jgi:hypothetical protein
MQVCDTPKGTLAPVPVAFVRPSVLDAWGLLPQTLVEISNGRRSLAVWLRPTTDGGGAPFAASVDNGYPLWLTARARTLLGVQAGDRVSVRVPQRVSPRVLTAAVDDLPGAGEIDVSHADARRVGRGRPWALLVSEQIAMPVRMRVRALRPGQIRLSMLGRVLLFGRGEQAGAALTAEGEGEPVLRIVGVTQPPAPRPLVLCEIPPDRLPFRDALRRHSRVAARRGSVAGLLSRGARTFSSGVEHGLRGLLLAPPFGFRTSAAEVGDDGNAVVRLHHSAFPLLGIAPGNQVLVQWADRQTIAIALESVTATEPDRPGIAALQRVEVFARRDREPGLEALTAGVAAGIRFDLGIPRHTVVTIRRRVTPLVVARLNELVIPLGGLLLAAAAIPGFRGWFLAAGALVVVLLSMLPLLYSSPPPGRWP